MAGLSLRHIEKIYQGGIKAVCDFNLEIKDKEFIVLVGPSGCGKSTTLRMVAGLEEISGGELYIDGVLVNDVLPKDRDIAMVFQDYALYPHMSVYENMAFGLKLRKTPSDEIRRRITAAAQILGIEKLLSRKPKALSGGQRQRVALGRAIVREPKVFLLDEPLSNLDAKLRAQMRTEITKLHNRLATTFIYVTHDQIEAMTMGTRIVVMKDGFMQQVDTPQNLYDFPINMFVAGFIGTPQMNFFNAYLVRNENNVYVKFGENSIKLPLQIVDRIIDKSYINNQTEIDEIANNQTESGIKKVVLGVRPEDIHDDATFIARHNSALVKGYIDVVEKLGSETLLYLNVEGREGYTIAKVDPRSNAQVNTDATFAIDMKHIHLFDAVTENTILDAYKFDDDDTFDAATENTVSDANGVNENTVSDADKVNDNSSEEVNEVQVVEEINAPVEKKITQRSAAKPVAKKAVSKSTASKSTTKKSTVSKSATPKKTVSKPVAKKPTVSKTPANELVDQEEVAVLELRK